MDLFPTANRGFDGVSREDFFAFCMYLIQHFFVCRPSDFTASEDAGIEPRIFATVATLALAARRSRLDLIHNTRLSTFFPAMNPTS